MSILDSKRGFLKRTLRLPARQTQGYLQGILDGSLLTPSIVGDYEKEALKGNVRREVLVLDYELPAPDQNAGSRTVFEHLKCLAMLGYKVHFWPLTGIYIPKYARPLRKMRINIVAGYFRASLRQWLKRHPRVDCAVLNRPEVAARLLCELRDAKVPVLYYGHDLHFERLRLESAVTGDQEIALRAERAYKIEREVWRRSNIVTYPSQEEVDRVTAVEAQVVAKVLLPYAYNEFPRRLVVPQNADLMFIGSFRHSPNLDAAVALATRIFPLVLEKVPNARLIIAGSNPTDQIKALANDFVKVVGWISDEELAELYNLSKVAVVPLQVGAGIKLKVVEALSRGTPLVTTPVGAQGLDGLETVASVHEELAQLADAVVRILQAPDREWLALSRSQLEFAENRFSIESMQASLMELIDLARKTPAVE